MAQNITLLGASYSNVPSVILPKTGGGTASFTDVSDTTAAASDVASGKYFYTASGVRTEGTSSGGGGNIQALSVTTNGTYTASGGVDGYSPVTVNVSGGSSRIVTGTFNTGSTSGVKSLTIPYTGSGYPIAFEIYVKGGAYNPDITAWYNVIQRYAVGVFAVVKSNTNVAPQYTAQSADIDGCVVFSMYKSSTSSATQYTRGFSTNATMFRPSNSSPSASNIGVACMYSSTLLKYYVASTSYGLLKDLDYDYFIVYSS